jgi:uncharacterized membrane protein YgcG
MRPLTVLLPVLLLSSSLSVLRAATPTAHLDDPAHLLQADPTAAPALEAKLAALERTSGIRILVQFHAKSPSAEEDKVPGAYMTALSRQLGTLQHGVLVVYFADDPDWRIWIGDDLAAIFAGRPGTVQELTENKAIHDVKEALLTSARAKADAALAALQKSAPPDRPPTAAQNLRLQTEALIDAVVSRLEPK